MKKSALLEYVLYCADKLMNFIGREAMTSDYFLLSVLQVISDRNNKRLPDKINTAETHQELLEVDLLLVQYNFDIEEAVRGIAVSVRSDEYHPSVDELVFGKFNYNAEKKAVQMDKKEIDVSVYVNMILYEPSKLIKKYIFGDDGTPSKPSSEQFQSTGFLEFTEERKTKHFTEMSFEDWFYDDVETEKSKASEEKAESNSIEKKDDIFGVKGLAETVEKTRAIQKFLLDSIFGQDQAVNSFVSGYFQAQLMSKCGRESRKSQATFLFAGPPGVGKTFLAEKAAEALQLPFRRFDMSEYSDKEANIEFCGSDQVYHGHKKGNVTSFVSENPRCVMLFDEIEKAHINVIYLFLQILDAGRIRDNNTDEEVSFSDAILIFTTNAGKNLYDDTSISNLSAIPRKKILKALSTDINPTTGVPLFPAAICSRFASGNIVMFNRLGAHNLFTIAKRELNNNISGLERSTGLKLNLDEKVPAAIILAEGGNADARTVTGRANAFFHEELYELFRLLVSEPSTADTLKTININVSIDGENREISDMFVNPAKPEILVFAEADKFASVAETLDSIEVHFTESIEQAKEILFNYDISVILCDVCCNPRQSEKRVLNVEDIASEGRDFLLYALSRYSIPVHLLQGKDNDINREEFLSFVKLGVQDILTFKGGDAGIFKKSVLEKCNIAYQQSNMLKLERENKVISYKTSQSISKSREVAEITLFDFKLSLAADIGDSKNILDNISKPDICFDDVIGAVDAKRELSYFVEYLKDPVKYVRKGVRAPKGVLLYGPPGTGKTLLAKAMAGESDVTFLTAEGNQFLKRYVGEGATAVHDLFASARKYAPSILFIDEIDAIGKDRAQMLQSDSTGDVLTAFLTEMDGFKTDTTKPVFVLAATNYEVEQGKGRSLDPALLRRFDRCIYVDLPSKDERKRFLYAKAKSCKMVDLSDEQIDNIAVRSTGMSLAELDSVFELALRNAIYTEGGNVDDASFEDAFETFNSGEKKQWSFDSLERTARHEAGHALMCWIGGEKPSYLTVVARGSHGGYMQHSDSEDKGLYTKNELLAKIRTSLAGRAAEIVYYGSVDGISTGAAGDLYSATRIAEQMICKYGMDEEIGLSYLDEHNSNSLYANDIRQRVNEILTKELNTAVNAVSENRNAIDKLVEALLDRNHLKENEIDSIIDKYVKRA